MQSCGSGGFYALGNVLDVNFDTINLTLNSD
jgi:hypothetical protein